MALDDPTGSRSPQSSVVVALNRYIENLIHSVKYKGESSSVPWVTATKYRTMMARLPRNSVLCEFQRQEFEAESASTGEEAPNWRQLIRMRTRYVALVLCLNIGVVPQDVMKISPCARMECWIDPCSITGSTAIKTIGNSLLGQYKRWHPNAHYELQLDPTVSDLKRICDMCRLNASLDRVLFHYNGHGVPNPAANGDIWVCSKGYNQCIPVSMRDLDSWLKTPSIYVFDCSSAGIILRALVQLQEYNSDGPSSSSVKDCLILAACEAHESLPQSADFPADVFTSCLTTPIKMALSWFCSRSLLRDSLDPSLIDKIPGHVSDRQSLLGELNWIFTAVTDIIAWNVLPLDDFRRLFRQDILVASLFRNFLLAERIMRSANCSPISYPLLPPTHQHRMWDAWDMAVESCLQSLTKEQKAEFQPSSFFDEQLAAFELWLNSGSRDKKPPEQLPVVLWVLPSKCHRLRALLLLRRFLDMGPWAVNMALSVGIFPYLLKLLQITASEMREILVFIWAKILAFDKSCQGDLIKDGRHLCFIEFLDSKDAYPEKRAMAAFVLTIIVDGHRQGQEACFNSGLLSLCLRYLQGTDAQTEPFLLQWICLCLGKLWENNPEVQMIALRTGALKMLALLSGPYPEVRASAAFALSNLLDYGSESSKDFSQGSEEMQEISIVRGLLAVVSDGSPLVRLEVAIALAHFALGHKQYLKSAAAMLEHQSSNMMSLSPFFANHERFCSGCAGNSFCMQHGFRIPTQTRSLISGCYSMAMGREGRGHYSDPATTGVMYGSPESDNSSQSSDSDIFNDRVTRLAVGYYAAKPIDDNIYYQCVSALCLLAWDLSPRVAGLGKQILKLVGIGEAASRTIWYGGGNNPFGVCSEVLQASNNHGRIARSSSWFDLTTGQLPWRPRVTFPSWQQQYCITRMQKVLSGTHLANSQDLGLADPLFISDELGHIFECSLPSHSAIYKWSCCHFSRPLATIDDNEENLSKREEREKFALDSMIRWQHFSVSKLNKLIARWDTNYVAGTRATLMEPFSPIVIASENSELIRVWNYEKKTEVNSFKSFHNQNFSNKGVTKLLHLNEFDDTLLLVASCAGNVCIWKDYTSMGEQKLVTAFSSIQSLGPGLQNVDVVIDWQQKSGYLYASGEISSILLWDMNREQCINSIPLSSEAGISALSASEVYDGQLAAGFKDGSVRLYDIRIPEMIVHTMKPHIQGKVVGLGFQAGSDPSKIVSASYAGDIQFLDIRNKKETYLSLRAYESSLTSFIIHRHAPLIASGSSKQRIKVFDLNGNKICSIGNHYTFMAEETPSASCLNFHPYKALLAAGATDGLLSIYSE